jgi:DNA-directed RNA polymerase specialized sigma24 family protein
LPIHKSEAFGLNSTQNQVFAAGIADAAKRGDMSALRELIARFALANEGLIRQQARKKLSAGSRQCEDSEDVLSSVLRRIDLLVSSDRFWVKDPSDIMGLILTVTRNTAVTKVRLAAQAKRLVASDGEYIKALCEKVNQCRGDDDAAVLVSRMLLSLDNTDQRQYLELRLRGATHRAAAQVLGISEDAARQRWGVIMKNLRALLTDMEKSDGQR